MTEAVQRFETTGEKSTGGARLVSRDRAISTFGVTYFHTGGFSRPIVEILGRHSHATMPNESGRFFESQTEAVSYVRRLARDTAQVEFDRCEEALKGWKVKAIRAASVVKSVKFSAPALVVKMTEDRLRKAQVILEEGFSPSMTPIPQRLRFPCVVSSDEPVFVVDYSRFVSKPIHIREERIVERSAIPTRGGDFDAVVRYRVSSLKTLLSYDHMDESTERLSKISDGVMVFLYRDAAERFVRSLVDRIQKSVDEATLALTDARQDPPRPMLVDKRAA
jgi:hypothetical protein